MIDMLKELFFGWKSSAPLSLVQRKYTVNYFLEDAELELFKKNGYVLLKDRLTPDVTKHLYEIYNALTQFKEYSIADKFQNSGRFRSPEIRNFVMDNIGSFSKEYLPKLFNVASFDENTTGAFQIKPPSKVSELNPHQDAPVIDELENNGLFVWIPLCDVTEKNGAIYILPGSHLWGNHQRSLNVHWPLEEHTRTLWKQMEPVQMKKGDILCWDTALIHASSPNLSNDTRVAITTTLLPKDFKMVEYFKDKDTPADSVEKYRVERSFWESEDIMKRPPCPPNQFLGLEKLAFPSSISKKQLLHLIEQTKNHISKR